MSFEKVLFDIFRVPYYDCWVFSRGQFYARFQKKVSGKRYIHKMMKLKVAFLTPKYDMVALRKGSGALTFYELTNAKAMELKEEDEVERDMNDDTTFLSRLFDRKVKAEVAPSYFVESRVDPEFLHEFLEADVVRDIMAKGKYELPSWVGTPSAVRQGLSNPALHLHSFL